MNERETREDKRSLDICRKFLKEDILQGYFVGVVVINPPIKGGVAHS